MSTTALQYPRLFISLIKFEHTVFALPFAYVGAFLVADGVPHSAYLVWLTVAMVGARSLAMAINRLVDADLDAQNPRTKSRELPRGLLSRVSVIVFCLLSLGLFLLAVSQLAPLVRWLWPIPIVFFVIYPYLKRFTWLCHIWLGVAIGLSPIAAWIAFTNSFSIEAAILGIAVATWVSGFDILYGFFDLEVDRSQGLHSIPARFGVVKALVISRLLHLMTVGFLAISGLLLDSGYFYWAGVGIVGILLVREHSLISSRDWRRLNSAFFLMNGAIALIFFAFVLIDVLR